MLKRLITLLGLFSLVVLLFFILFFSPREIGPLGVLVFFVVSYVFLFSVCSFFVFILSYFFNGKRRDRKANTIYSTIVSFGLILLLLAIRMYGFDIFMVVGIFILVFLCCFFAKRRLNMVK